MQFNPQVKLHSNSLGTDPLWYKDAVIYQVHVKSYADSNGDGIGDFPGLAGKLDYIAELGVDTLWLLPFYSSPLRDDGYDISDYRSVHPAYGTLADVRKFIRAAHERKIRVITELIINHTSNQHPWFERARRAKPGSAARNYYVWSHTDQAYAGTRIIFLDTETSNWTWDPVAGAYFWHRFYSHQPDLNFDNPQVIREVISVMRFWLDLGVDGLRLDAIPYLVEREGTNNENLPETHAVLKHLRAAMDTYAPGRMLLAEANQWPEDAQEYFGNGDECNMSFHFPLMPRMYMAIAQEDRFPITDIMRQTPAIPPNCQWAVFLRNHDELTLEMVTDSERDYLWNAYASDRRARLNLGIRRRLAPLLEHDRRRIELMNGLLLSMPGTPVIYYGDEIGMGDNIYLGDRNGVRTPMQWSPDRNGGFSRANPESLVLPSIMDPMYGYSVVNVEAQLGDSHSLLNWTRRLIAVRRSQPAFGRGSQRFLYPRNRKILAFLRQDEHSTLLCISNLSRTAQAVELELSEFEQQIPIDLVGGSPFPPIGQLPYLLTLPPYAFFWFILVEETDMPTWHTPAPEPLGDLTTLVLRHGLTDVLDLPVRSLLEAAILPPYLTLRRWFSSKDQVITGVRLSHVAELVAGPPEFLLTECEVSLGDRLERYQLPLGIVWEGDAADPLPQQLALARVRRGRRVGIVTDAFAIDDFAPNLLRLLREQATIATDGAELCFSGTERLTNIEIDAKPSMRRLSAEQSNSSLIVGDKAMIKLMRRGVAGIHPEVEMSAYLTASGYANTPPLLGTVERKVGGQKQTVFIVQGFVRNEGDGWSWVLDFLSRSTEALAVSEEHLSAEEDVFRPLTSLAGAIGRRLYELHAVLARPTDNVDFAPEQADEQDARLLAEDIGRLVERAFASITAHEDWPDQAAAADARFVCAHAAALLDAVGRLQALIPGTPKTRIHGDFHLGQVLVVKGDAVLIDFEGEPARPVRERRAKSNPLRDVAGMLRSFDYAHAFASAGRTATSAQTKERRIAMLNRAHQRALASFFSGYQAELQAGSALLDLFLLQKAAYEICYEAANRIAWLPVPVRGLAAIAARVTGISRS